MARKPKQGEESAFSKLTPAQQRAWLAFIRLRLRLTYEMNRQLQAETNLSRRLRRTERVALRARGADADHRACHPNRLGTQPPLAPPPPARTPRTRRAT